MWYFSWVLGVGLAVSFAVLNGLWHEFMLPREVDEPVGGQSNGFVPETTSS